MSSKNNLDATCINTIRTLPLDAVQAANSGYPDPPLLLELAPCLQVDLIILPAEVPGVIN